MIYLLVKCKGHQQPPPSKLDFQKAQRTSRKTPHLDLQPEKRKEKQWEHQQLPESSWKNGWPLHCWVKLLLHDFCISWQMLNFVSQQLHLSSRQVHKHNMDAMLGWSCRSADTGQSRPTNKHTDVARHIAAVREVRHQLNSVRMSARLQLDWWIVVNSFVYMPTLGPCMCSIFWLRVSIQLYTPQRSERYVYNKYFFQQSGPSPIVCVLVKIATAFSTPKIEKLYFYRWAHNSRDSHQTQSERVEHCWHP